jgi:arylsulfatase A-like enzyme
MNVHIPLWRVRRGKIRSLAVIRSMALILVPVLFLFPGSTSCTRQEPVLPNILLICADDLGWSDVGCYGSEVHTPNIDALARQGMRFTQFHNTSKCFPSRACLLTGLYAQQCGYDRSFEQPLRNAVTLGEVLRGAGYITLWSGKHHGLENPVYRGFDHYYGLKDGACNYFNPGEQRPGEGAPARKGRPGSKRDREWCIDSVMYRPYNPEAKDFYTTDYFTRYALKWLEEYREDDRPLFLYLAYTAPHDPLMAWPEDIRKYEGMYDAGYEKIRQERYHRQLGMGLIDSTYRLSVPLYPPWDSLPAEMKKEEIRKMEVYAAMIDRLDQDIGKVVEKLKETGRWKNTLVLFVSDNGASAEVVYIEDDYGETGTMTRWSSLEGRWANVSNTPFRYYKNYSFEGGINTPLIARWPGKIQPGSFSRFPGHFIDIMATLVDVTGAPYPREYNGEEIFPMEGESLLPAFNGEEVTRTEPLFWEWQHGQAVRYGDWKLVRHGLERDWDLYRVTSDPTETMNLAPENPRKVEEMERLFLSWKNGLGPAR